MERETRHRETIASLMEDVAAGIRVLATRDGVAVSERQVWERARNIVAGLMGNYRIVSFGDEDDEDFGRFSMEARNDTAERARRQAGANDNEEDAARRTRDGEARSRA